ncbi:MAG: Gx transporter family protein [Clostridiales bacterium]|nr:Gx transporter family protein [Clostridiales bacterium]
MAKRLAYYANLLALALALSWLELLIPFSFGIPGVKLGLTNIAVVFVLYRNGLKPALLLQLARILLVSLLFGHVMGLIYSLAGGLLSLLMMALLKRLSPFSQLGVSLAGGVTHNVGQWCAALLVMPFSALLYYLPFLLIAGALTGLLVGFLARLLIPIPDRLHIRGL